MAWADELAAGDDRDLSRLARILAHPDVVARLRALATALRDERTRACEIEARRAPVMLVLPLTLCFLPAFGLIMAVPLLGGLTG
jgi:pilus assembly protein TadC